MTSKLIEKPADLSEYLFRITDNGGESADRYTVIFSDGDYLGMSGTPSHPQGVCMSGAGIDVQRTADNVEAGREIDMALGDMPEACVKAIIGSVNDWFQSGIDEIDKRNPNYCAPTREKAKANEGTHDSAFKGIYSAGEGYCVRLEGDDAALDRGPFITAREALLATLPDIHALTGPEYQSTVDPCSMKRTKGVRTAVRKLEKKIEKRWEQERERA